MMAEDSKYGGIINIHVRRDPRGGFDPQIPGGRREARQVQGLPYELLAIQDTTPDDLCAEVLVPYVAESWTFSGDLKTMDITLRKGVKFHDVAPVNGREMVAEDLVYSYERMFERGIQKTVGENIESIEAVDKYTLRIKTKNPAPGLPLQLLSYRAATILAKEAIGPDGGFDTKETVIGTGPFVLTEYTPGVGHVLTRNPDYWAEGLPYADGMKLSIMRDTATKVAALQIGKLDFLEEVSISAKQRLQKRNPGIRYTPCETSSYILWMNLDIPPFGDVRVRRAFSMAMDREAIIKGPFRGEGKALAVGQSYWENALQVADYPPETRKYLQFNPTASRALLAEAGFPNGIEMSFFVGFHHGSPFREIVESLPALMRPAGITVTLDPQELAAYQEGTSKRLYGAVAVAKTGYGSPHINALSSLRSTASPSANRPGINEPEIDALVDRMNATADPKERADLQKQLQIMVVDRAYFVMFPGFFRFNAFGPRVNGEFKGNGPMMRYQTGALYRQLWLTQEK
jgi:peptide/nickel transport system substrate-binding protein